MSDTYYGKVNDRFRLKPETVYLFHYPRGYFTNRINHTLEGKMHGVWPVARVKKHAIEATVTVETVASRASGPVKEGQGNSCLP